MIDSQPKEARYRLLGILIFIVMVFSLAVGFPVSTRQFVLAEREPMAREERFNASAIDGARTPFGASFEATPEFRVEPSSLTLPRDRNALPEAIIVAEIGAKQGVQDVTLYVSRVRDARGREVIGDFVSFEPNGFDLAAGASQAITLTLSADPPLPPGFYSGEIVIESANAETQRLPFDLDTGFRVVLPAVLHDFTAGAGSTNQAPNSPTDPFPSMGGTHQSVDVNLGWSGGDPDGGTVTYDVYLEAGDSSPDVSVCSEITSTYCEPDALREGKHYYWQVIATDLYGVVTEGPVWEFFTGYLPDTPVGPSPTAGAVTPDLNVNLGWTGGDPDGGAVTYDVYLKVGNETPAVLVCDNVMGTSCDPGALSYGTHYYWQVIATNFFGLSTAGPLWDFVANDLPHTPSSPSPGTGAITANFDVNLSWVGGDPDGDAVTYDVFLDVGDSSPSTLVCNDVSGTFCDPGTLSEASHRYWQVVATDSFGQATTGPVWDFVADNPPNVPSDPSPPDGTFTQETSVTLIWVGGDPDGASDPVTYDVYFEANDTTPDVLVSDNQSTTDLNPGVLSPGTRYYWRIVAADSYGVETWGSIWALTVVSDPPQLGCWFTQTSMPTARRAPAAVELDGMIYVLGGQYGDLRFDVVERFDPASNSWAIMAPMPTPRAWLVAAAVNGKIYAIGGSNIYGKLNTVEEYDPATNSWTTKAPMPTGRDDAAVGVVNGKIYVIGGWLSAQAINTVEEYDPVTNTWAARSPMPVSLAMSSASAVGGKIYVFGGYDGLDATAINLMYDPVADSWYFLPNMPTSRDRLATAVVDGKIYVVGGRNGGLGWLDLTQRFDPNTYQWTNLNSVPTPRGDLAAAAAGGQVFAFGGRNTWTGPVLNVNEALDLACGGSP